MIKFADFFFAIFSQRPMDLLRMAAMAQGEYLDDTSVDEEDGGYDMNSNAFFKDRMNQYIRMLDKSKTSPVGAVGGTGAFFLKERYLLLRAIASFLISEGVTIFGGPRLRC